MFWSRKKNQASAEEKKTIETIQTVFHQLSASDDFKQSFVTNKNRIFCIGYYETLTDSNVLHSDILPNVQKAMNIEEFTSLLPFEDLTISKDVTIIQDALLKGSVCIFESKSTHQFCLIKAKSAKERQVAPPEVEFSVVGPKEAFVESYETNIHLIRKRLPVSDLIVKERTVGRLSKTKVGVLYIEGIANKENYNTVLQRIEDLNIDQIVDSSYLTQLIQDNQNSPFPQFIDTERPDRIASVLGEGKVAIIVDGAPHALIGPTTIFEFFSAFEDYYLNWLVASFFRLVRFFAVLFSILVTPLYVAVLTYHYELIPKDMVSTLVTSRTAIPLPPILEALILELAIELLREAGARLPTKVGQTIGIVGGIVIGTASVEAGLTSNVLLIIVALAALASFTTPVYQMGNTIRLIRFPFLLMSHYIGLIGVAISFCFLLIHLLRLSSLGRPFLEPLYPLRIFDLKDALIRLPFLYQSKRPIQAQTEDTLKFSASKAKQKNEGN
ncbi:spore germination protein [Cytobacillus gottheilii]|uniref:spore germination protein n=1 Tax=Cytobacillus gottheilii TaxID=859144 RepID=UPI0009B94332|nr:spore germination protein [Cytobacillus gottheilii]